MIKGWETFLLLYIQSLQSYTSVTSQLEVSFSELSQSDLQERIDLPSHYVWIGQGEHP
jgi:hypothetical protein